MSKEAVIKIKDAEKQAQLIIANANQAAKKLVEETQVLADVECRLYEETLSADYKERIDQVQTEAGRIISANKQKCSEQAELVSQSARVNMIEAVKTVVRRVMSECQ